MQSKPFALLVAGALAATIAAGCSKGSDQSSSSSTTTTATTAPVVVSTAPGSPASSDTSASTTASTSGTGDAAHGKAIFGANCTTCHGATGAEGGVGPSLKNEKSRKNFGQTVAWIKNPQPPMPKLYPAPLSEKDVEDVAAFVQTIGG